MRKLHWLIMALYFCQCGGALADVTWNAGAGYRNVVQLFDDGLGTKDANGKDSSVTNRKRWQYRALIGPSETRESLDWGVELRTQPSGLVNTDWVSSGNNLDLHPAMSLAYARLHGKVWGGTWAVTLGRQRNAILYDDVAQTLYGNPVRWDGFGWNFQCGNFGLNFAQYVFGATNNGVAGTSTYSLTDSSQSVANTQSHFAVLYAFQPYLKIPISTDILSTLALGFYNWSGVGGNNASGFFDNAVHAGTPGTVGDVTPVSLDNARQWHLLSDTTLPYDFRFVGEVVRNKAVVYGSRLMAASPLTNADRTSFALSLVVGRPKKAGDLSFQYSYANKGIGSVFGTLTTEDIAADNISHLFELRYLPVDTLSLAARLQYHREKAKLGGDGQPLGTPYNGREETQRRIELNAQIQI